MVRGRFSAKAIKSFWKVLGQPGNQRAVGEAPGQPEYQRAGPYRAHGTLRWWTSTARLLKTCSNGLRRNKLAAPGKAVVLRGIGGFSVESSVHACPPFVSNIIGVEAFAGRRSYRFASITTSTSGPVLRRLENLGRSSTGCQTDNKTGQEAQRRDFLFVLSDYGQVPWAKADTAPLERRRDR